MSSIEDATGVRRVEPVPGTADAVQIGIAYSRRSQDSGKGASEEIQDESIREVAERLGIRVEYWLPTDQNASSFTLERPSFQKALRLLASGRANVLFVAKLNRLTRRRKHWEEILELAEAQGWRPVSAEFPELDLLSDNGRLIAGFFIDQGEREYRERRRDGNKSREHAVLTHGIHGGHLPPLGYQWTQRLDKNGKPAFDKKSRPLRGPLVPAADASRIGAAHDAIQSPDPRERAWPNIVRILRVGSRSAALKILRNRVYLGIAYSGVYEREGAHPALVDEVKFRRTQRLLDQRSGEQKPSKGSREGALLAGGILRCTCGRALTREASPRGDFYRCKNYGVDAHGDRLCPARASIQASLVESVVLAEALRGHAARTAFHVPEIDAIGVEVFEEALAEAQAAVEELDRALDTREIDALSYGKAATVARAKLVEAQDSLAAAEASKGWLALSPAAVSRRLLTEDGTVKHVVAARDFIKQTVRVTVKPVGSGRRVPVTERISVEVLTPQQGIVLREVPIPAGGEIEAPSSAAELVLHQLPCSVAGLVVSAPDGNLSYVAEAAHVEAAREPVRVAEEVSSS